MFELDNNDLWIAYLFAEDMVCYLLRCRSLSYRSASAYYHFHQDVHRVFTDDIGKLLNYYAQKVPLRHLLTDAFVETLKDKQNFESFVRTVFANFMNPNISLHRLLQILSIISKICIYCCSSGDYSAADVTIRLVAEALNNRLDWSDGRILFNDLNAMDHVKRLVEAPVG